jgi:hypothetical protein
MTNLNWDRVRDDKKLKGGSECNYYGGTSISDHEGSLDAVTLDIAQSKNKKRKLAKQAVKLESKIQAAEKAKIKAENKNKLRKFRRNHPKGGLKLKNKKYRSRTIEFEFSYLSELLRYNRFSKIKERAAMVTFRNWFHILQINNNLITLHTLLCTTLKSVIKTKLFSEEHTNELSGMYHKLLSSKGT